MTLNDHFDHRPPKRAVRRLFCAIKGGINQRSFVENIALRRVKVTRLNPIVQSPRAKSNNDLFLIAHRDHDTTTKKIVKRAIGARLAKTRLDKLLLAIPSRKHDLREPCPVIWGISQISCLDHCQ